MANPLAPSRAGILLAIGWLAVATLEAKPIRVAGTSAVSRPESRDTTETAPGALQFDTSERPLPPNVASLAFEATGTSEIGDLIRLGGTAHGVDRVTVTMSSWASRADFPGNTAGGYTHPLTLQIFAVDRSGPTPRVGILLATVTQPFLIPWRAEADAADGTVPAGRAFNVTFDFAGVAVWLPDEIIYSISFNTQHHGLAPLGVPGPYDFLGVGVSPHSPSAGIDAEPDAVFWKTANASNYADGGAAGVDVFRRDTGWAPHQPMVRFATSAYGTLAATTSLLRTLHSTDKKTDAAFREAAALATDALNRKLWNGNHHLSVPIGFLIFELLSEAADDLTEISTGSAADAALARRAISGLINTAESVSAAAVTDAIRARGDARRTARAEARIAGAGNSETRRLYGEAIEQFGDAWREAQLAQP